MDDLVYYVYYGIRICINIGTQIGASALLLFILLLLSSAGKRRSTVFILNAVALLLNVVRSILGVCYYTGPFYHPYPYFSGDYSDIPTSAFGVSISANIFTLIVLVLVESSLIFQIRVASVTTRKVNRFWIMLVSICVAMVAIGFRFALTVVSARATLALQNTDDINWLPNATNITTTISICFFCAIFLFKLGFAILQRRSLGIHKFGPMQAIFIMGCQTLLIPALFSIFEYVGSDVELASQTLTTCTLFLPLSSMWASATLEQASTTRPAAKHNRFANPTHLPPTPMTGSTAVEMRSPVISPTKKSHGSEKDSDCKSLV
ncbi:hypothetical protein NA57DRAFT_64014 [Rhizodiscina lignyota]|uniref:Pheromone alpha factor receptor n=1 Tax=Rhizodiscina lignyota TaxID=1504668 RepID=A0A9P4IQI3_9PEZI|nr:hypothetical protein NA57DRAFT_64014 [Rhizodiscina lignyota]